MLFKSPHGNMDFKIRRSLPTYNAMGEVIMERPAVRAVFGRWIGGETMVSNPLGDPIPSAELVGHFFDTDVWYEERLGDSTDPAEVARCAEEKEQMERHLLRRCREMPGTIQLVQRVTVPYPKPWLTYDEQTPGEVVDAAQLLGMVAQAVAYERINLNRPDVLDVLEPLLDGPIPEPDSEFPEGSLDVPAKQGVAIGAAQARTEHGMMLNTPRIEL